MYVNHFCILADGVYKGGNRICMLVKYFYILGTIEIKAFDIWY